MTSDTHHTEELTLMGKGDRRTRRGKIWRGTYGKRRPRRRNNKKKTVPPQQSGDS